MLDHEDLKWIATTSTELNSMLQQISRYSDLAKRHKGEYNYVEILGERVEMASRTAQGLFDRVTSNILAGRAANGQRPRRAAPTAFSILPAPVPVPAAAITPVAEIPTVRTNLGRPIPELQSIPLPSAPAPATERPDFEILNPQGKRELILLVDDEVEISTLASMMLTDEGYQVILAKDGFEALKIYAHLGQQIRLVILDFFLPIMDGDVVFDELRALNPKIDVVLSSGFAEQSKVGAMLALGLRGFIPKPYTSEKLLEQIRSTLDAGRQLTR